MKNQPKKNGAKKSPKSATAKQMQRAEDILEGALKVFGEKGFEAATISEIAKAAKISDATFYDYFKSKEEVLFSIPEHYTRRELDRMKEVGRYVHCPKQRMRSIIQAYLEFYESEPLYTSVALLTLKGNRNFLGSPAYNVIRESSRSIVETFEQGVEQGVFRQDLDKYLVRNLVLGFIEHLTIQWLLTKRPETISPLRDTIWEMVMRAIENPQDTDTVRLELGLNKDQLRKIMSPE